MIINKKILMCSNLIKFKRGNFTQQQITIIAYTIKKLKNIIYTNLVVAFSAGILSSGFCHYLQIEHWLFYGIFSFFSTLAVYNGQRLFKSNREPITDWLQWVNKNQRSLFLLVIFAVIMAFSSFLKVQKLDWRGLTLLFLSGLISVFYVLRIRGKNMREIPYIKIHLIAFTWVVVLIAFPILNERIDTSLIAFSTLHYLYVLAITIPFDIRDIQYDTPSQKTIPQLIGVKKAKLLAAVLLLIFAIGMMYFEIRLTKNPLFYLSVFVQLFLVVRMKDKNLDFYTAGWIDGAIMLLGLSYFFV